MTSDLDTRTFRVLVEDRLAFEAEGVSLGVVLDEVAGRLRSLPGSAPDADLVVWRGGRVEAVAHCRGGRLVGVTRPESGEGRASRRDRRPTRTIGALMFAVLVAATILAAFRSEVALLAFGSAALGILVVVIAGSLLMSIHHIWAFFRDTAD